MSAAVRTPPLFDLLAANDNARTDEGVLSTCPRAQAALSSPLRRACEVPAPACRAWHALGADRVLSSTLVVEWIEREPRWRASVTIWGALTRERRDVALLLAQHVLGPLGEGSLEIDRGASTVFVRRALSARERAALTRTRLSLA